MSTSTDPWEDEEDPWYAGDEADEFDYDEFIDSEFGEPNTLPTHYRLVLWVILIGFVASVCLGWWVHAIGA